MEPIAGATAARVAICAGGIEFALRLVVDAVRLDLMPEARSLDPSFRDLDDSYREFLSILTDANEIGWRELEHNAALVTAG